MSRKPSIENSSRVQPQFSRRTTPAPENGIGEAENLILPDGPISEETTELLQDFVHLHHHQDETLVDSEDETVVGNAETVETDDKLRKPWWKRPSPWWMLAILPFTAAAMSAGLAPRIEIYTMLACSVHKPDIFKQAYPGVEIGSQSVPSGVLHFAAPATTYPIAGTYEILEPRWTSQLHQLNGADTPPPNKRNLCAKDPVVQAAVAKLTAVMSTTLGILSCITTAWWGAYSDRWGRTRVMGISIIGLLVSDVAFILVALNARLVPGGYWFLPVASVMEGLFGGTATGIASVHSYIADTTNESNRSRTLSLSLGLMFIGLAFGPTIGSVLIRLTGSTLSVFYAGTLLHLTYAFLSWFVIPESLSIMQRNRSKARHVNELEVAAIENSRTPAVGLLSRLKNIFAFLSPLTVFLPVVEAKGKNPLKKERRNWNLTIMAASYAFTVSVMGSYSYKFQFAAATFGWSSETLGYWLSLVGAARAFYLALVLPIAIKLLKPHPLIIEIPTTTSSPELLRSSNGSSSPASHLPVKFVKKEIHSPSFDLNLARFSLLVEIIAYAAIAFAPTPLTFTIFSMMSSFGAGFSPASQSVTLALYTRRGNTETGRLFGALSVIQALSGQIIGPSLYGIIYMKTVSTFPKMIFFVTAATVTTSFCLMTLVRLPPEADFSQRPVTADEEETSVLDGFLREETLIDSEDDAPDHTILKRKAPSYGAVQT